MIIFMSGTALVNGLGCSYSVPHPTSLSAADSTGARSRDGSRLELPAPKFSSPSDSPVRHSMAIPRDDWLQSVQVYSGDVVDSVVIRTAGGREWRVGGSGGSPSSVVCCHHDDLNIINE